MKQKTEKEYKLYPYMFCNVEGEYSLRINKVSVADELNEEFNRFCIFLIENNTSSNDMLDFHFIYTDFKELLTRKFGVFNIGTYDKSCYLYEELLIIADENIVMEEFKTKGIPIIRNSNVEKFVLSDLPETAKAIAAKTERLAKKKSTK